MSETHQSDGIYVRVKTIITDGDVTKWLLSLFTFFVVFTPVDVFQMKKTCLILLLAINMFHIRPYPAERLQRNIYLFGLWMTGLSILLSIIMTSNIYGNVVQGYVGFILLLYFPIEDYNIDFPRIFERTLFILALFTVGMAFLDIVGIIPMMSNRLLMWMSDTGIAYVGKHSNLATGYMIFVKTSPLLVLLLPTLYERKRYVGVFICFLAICISGTRANIFVGLVVLISSIAFKKQKNALEVIVLVLSAMAVIMVVVRGSFITRIISMFDRKSSDDAVRNGILYSILKGFRDNPRSLLLGSGYSSLFYNAGRNELSSIVELSYWNLLRQVGLVVFIPMLYVYVYPAVKLMNNRRTFTIAIAYVGYLMIAYTNPLLYSTTGVLGLLYMYTLVDNSERICLSGL